MFQDPRLKQLAQQVISQNANFRAWITSQMFLNNLVDPALQKELGILPYQDDASPCLFGWKFDRYNMGIFLTPIRYHYMIGWWWLEQKEGTDSTEKSIRLAHSVGPFSAADVQARIISICQELGRQKALENQLADLLEKR